jgi:hypothetical protein
MPLPTDVNSSPNYTAAQHATHHNDIHAHVNSHSGSTVRGSLGYAQVTATQGSITTEVDLTSLTVTATVNSGERIRVKGNILVQTSVANDIVYLRIKESTTVLQIASLILTNTADVYVLPVEVILTPSAASHTYKLSLARQGGTGNISMVAGATFPAFILVEGIGT